MNDIKYKYDLPRIIFGVLFIALMIISCLWVVTPFILGFTWASMVVIATWPLMIRLQKLLWGKRWLAVGIMTFILFLVFIIPISLIIVSFIKNSEPIIAWASQAKSMHIPDFEWLKDIPMVGDRVYARWHILMGDGGNAIMEKMRPYIGQAITWFFAQIANIGSFVLHCTLMLLFSALLYARGEDVAQGVRHFAFRLGQERGDSAVVLAARAIRAVALGVVVTALLQSVLAGIGLSISGIHYAALLTILMFVCCLAQLGPMLVLIPAVAWLYWHGDTTWGTVLLVWSCVVGAMDGVLRPVLIKMGANLPMILILSGVIGGLLSFGMIGLFIGPVVLAVSYRLVHAWVSEAPDPQRSLEQVVDEVEQVEPVKI